MKLNINDIPDSGLHLDLNRDSDRWFQVALDEALEKWRPADTTAEGSFSIQKINTTISLSGHVSTALKAECSRCLTHFQLPLEIDIHQTLIPVETNRQLKTTATEQELTEEDLEFSTYHYPMFQLDEIIREQVALAIPIRFLCQEDCRGLCSQCGCNQNETSCSCQPVIEDHPFAALKSFSV